VLCGDLHRAFSLKSCKVLMCVGVLLSNIVQVLILILQSYTSNSQYPL